MKEWIIKEFATADMGDKRLLDRLQLILERLIASPRESLKSALKGWAEITGAYRFFNNQKTNIKTILDPHRDATVERVKAFEQVMVIQDTTELDYTLKKTMAGKGPLSTIDRQGFFAHNHLVITPGRLPLGVWDTSIYARDEADQGKSARRKQKPIEEKESVRWLEGYMAACELKRQAPKVEVISCGDRENDIYEVFHHWDQRKEAGLPTAEWVIRCNYNRALQPTGEEVDAQRSLPHYLIEKLTSSEVLGEFTLQVTSKIQWKKVKGSSKKGARSAREAVMELRQTSATLRPPYRKGQKLSAVTVNAVLAKEKHPPEGEEPIEWILLTSLDTTRYSDALKVVEMYAARWEIEVFHRVLKTGCQVEELQLKKDDRVKVAIALYMVVAWRVMYLMKLGRECPDLPCDVVFDEDEWQGFWVIAHNGDANSLARKPNLGEFMIKVAEFGGFIGRKGDGYPGPQAIWQGLQQVRHFALAWQILVKKEGYKALTNKS